jgi:type I restriction-modification system DNA methylase subunit
MANEELSQRGYLSTGRLKGERFGPYEKLDLGKTSVAELKTLGIDFAIPDEVPYPFKLYKKPRHPSRAQPDHVYLERIKSQVRPVLVGEFKRAERLTTPRDIERAIEQAIYSGASMGVRAAVVTDAKRVHYIDIPATLAKQEVVRIAEDRDFNPATLHSLINADYGQVKDPTPLAEEVWQLIWHATQAEVKECLLTFVELFMLKFLSDNLSKKELPEALSFYELTVSADTFLGRHGQTQIEYYASKIRPRIKTLFPDSTRAEDKQIAQLFGLDTLVSKTSIINGFAFLKSSADSISAFNATFLKILGSFQRFGPLTKIDPEFKLRLYETFLRRSARQQTLGQFFTPRNVVRPIIRMAELEKLQDGAVVLDPAAGVGGFVLEPMLIEGALQDNVTIEKGRASRRVKLVGADLDANTHILAKANTLLHLAEYVRGSTGAALNAINLLMAETFVLFDQNAMLGSLEFPPQGTVDVIMTNPPYVTRGSAVFKGHIRALSDRMRNGVDLREYYAGAGLGVEALFLRYISGALKPGGRAFVIVPHGLLNRTERSEAGPKARLLDECNILASIALPRNTFFNTSQVTYILVLERRWGSEDKRPEVFCALADSIGETLDQYRAPTPSENDLEAIANVFVAYSSGDRMGAKDNPRIKLIPAVTFGPEHRWDVERFWTDEELVKLGRTEAPVGRSAFIDEVQETITELAKELKEAQRELRALSTGATNPFILSDKKRFLVGSGVRLTRTDVRAHPGKLPVFSCFANEHQHKGGINEKWLDDELKARREKRRKRRETAMKAGRTPPRERAREEQIEDKPVVTVMANGATAVGKVFVRRERCVLTDDVIVVESKDPDIDLDYLAIALRDAIAKGNFLYEAKLFAGRVSQLSVDIPVDENGEPDLERQKAIASAVQRFDTLRERIGEMGKWSTTARLV